MTAKKSASLLAAHLRSDLARHVQHVYTNSYMYYYGPGPHWGITVRKKMSLGKRYVSHVYYVV